MNKFWIIIMVMLILVNSLNVHAQEHNENTPSSESFSDMSRSNQQEYLEETLGILGVNPDNVGVVGSSVTLLLGGFATLETKTGVEVTLDGGNADASSYDGTISIGDGGGVITTKKGDFEFDTKGKITIVNGEIVSVEKGNMIKGTLNGNEILNGRNINWNSKTNIISSDKSIKLNGIKLQPYGNYEIDLSKKPPLIDTKGNEMGFTSWDIAIPFGIIKGKFQIDDDNLILIGKSEIRGGGNSELHAKFSKSAIITSRPCTSQMAMTCIEVDEYDVVRKVIAKNNDKEIELEIYNADYTLQVNKINDKSRIKLTILKRTGKISAYFSKDHPILKGDFSDVDISIIHKYSSIVGIDKELIIEKGKVETCLNKCKNKGIIYSDFIDLSNTKKNKEKENAVYNDMKRYVKKIKELSNSLGVDPKTVASILYVEKVQYELNTLRKGKEILINNLGEWSLLQQNVIKWAKLSSGYAHIKTSTVIDTKDRLDKIPEFKNFITEEDVYDYPNNPISSIKIAIGMLKSLQDEWKNDPNGIDISNRPEILSTLYNLGYSKSQPKKNPKPGGTYLPVIVDGQLIEDMNFGNKVKLVYNSEIMNGLFN